MRIGLFSDLHTEFGDWEAQRLDADVICLLGDIATTPQTYRNVVLHVKEKNPQALILCLLGNHEGYGREWTNLENEYCKALSGIRNVELLNDRFIDVDDYRFIAATLWTDLSDPMAALEVGNNLNDYRRISVRESDGSIRRLRPQDTNTANQQSIRFIKETITEIKDSKKCIVLTHHAPSLQSNNFERYKNVGHPLLVFGWCNRLDADIEKLQPALWLHGHLHETKDYTIGETRIKTNPRGYVGHEVNENFDELGAIITLP